jgi:hypothetical protein
MVPQDMVDHPDVQALVTQAREGLAAGKDKEARGFSPTPRTTHTTPRQSWRYASSPRRGLSARVGSARVGGRKSFESPTCTAQRPRRYRHTRPPRGLSEGLRESGTLGSPA